MTIAYVNAGALNGTQNNTTATLILPASIVAGNILVLILYKSSTGSFTLPAGWTSLGEEPTSFTNSIAAYRIADGSDTNPTITWATSAVLITGRIFQYSGANAIGSYNSNADPTSTHSVIGITSTANNSLAIYLDTSDKNTALVTPAGFTLDLFETWGSGDNAGGVGAYHMGLGLSGSTTGNVSTTGSTYNSQWLIELKFEIVPIDAPAESSSSASSTSAGGLGIASAAESSGAAATESSYTFAIGAFATSSGAVSGSLSLIFEKAASAISSGILSQETLVGFMANADAVSTGVDASSATVTRFTFELINTGITITGEVKASRIYYDIGSSSGNIASAVEVLRTMDASVIANALLATGAIGSAYYYLIAESLAQMISGIVYVNDYVDGWAYNLNNQAPSFYENFKFNSFAKIGNDYYGLNASGLHIINANDDNGTQIDAVITTGISDFEDERTKKIQLIYANSRTESALELTVRVDNEPEYSYDFISSSAGIAPTRVKLGKGLQGRNWQIEIKNKNGADFEISDLDIPILPNSRRV